MTSATPTVFRVSVIDVKSFGRVDYNYGEDGLDNYEDTQELNLADFTVEGDLDAVFTKLASVLPDVAPGRGPFSYNGMFVSTSEDKKDEDRVDVLITDGSAESDYSIWLFGEDTPEPEVARLVAKLAACGGTDTTFRGK